MDLFVFLSLFTSLEHVTFWKITPFKFCLTFHVCFSDVIYCYYDLQPVQSDQVQTDTGLRVVKFCTTPIMSTYLVAVVVGEYDFVEDVSRDGVQVRVYTPVGKSEQGRFALDVATKVLPYYKEYFQIAYPLPKIDLIAIADFSSGT